MAKKQKMGLRFKHKNQVDLEIMVTCYIETLVENFKSQQKYKTK